MNTLKKFIGFACVATALLALAALMAPSGVAQLAPPTTSTITVNANVTSNTPIGTFTIDCRKQQNVAIGWEFELGGSGTEVMGLRLVGSAYPDKIATTPTLADGFSIALAANGTTTVRATTNFTVKGWPYLHCYYITNGNASSVLTNRISYWVKPNAP